ncbi:MAG: class I SAM-dependent methyltransferase [Clostridiaceae bacterium]|jgi:SAM-dependent methyltransferase|nr:class I SAM-dependent methyltransferase [Clostridiaceae bacterium]
MGNVKKYWARQFGNPTGVGGKIAAFIMNRMNKEMYRSVVASAPQNGRILDVGFGNGALLKRLSRATDADLFGIDISDDMVDLAAKRNRKAVENGKLTLAKGSADNIVFDGQFDFVYTVNTVYFWQNLEEGLAAIKDKLSDGGKFINVVYTKEWLDKLSYTRYGFAKYAPDELVAAVVKIGLKAEIIEINRGKSFCVCATRADGDKV